MTVLSSSDAAYSLEHLACPDGPPLRPRVRSALPLLPEPQLLLDTLSGLLSLLIQHTTGTASGAEDGSRWDPTAC